MKAQGRRDRMLRLLRARTRWTLAQLAHELAVSRRTLLRDVGVLREAGYDLETLSGPGGGVQLNPASVMLTTHLSVQEVISLVLSVEIARASAAIPFASGAEHALAKIEQALPADRVHALRTFRERILVGRPSPTTTGPTAAIDPDLLVAFELALARQQALAFTYRDRNGRISTRTAEPHGLLVRYPLWYLIGWDTDQNAARLFRADRITHTIVTAHTFTPRPSELVTGVCPDAVPAHAESRGVREQPWDRTGPDRI